MKLNFDIMVQYPGLTEAEIERLKFRLEEEYKLATARVIGSFCRDGTPENNFEGDFLRSQKLDVSVTEGDRLDEIAREFERAIPTEDGKVLAAMIRQGVTVLESHIQYAMKSHA